MYVTVQDFKFWIETAGNFTVSRPSVLLLHGFPDSSKLWSSQVSALAAAGYYVIAPDMLGYGRSDKPTDAKQYALRSMVTLLCALLDNLGVTGKVVVVGHDWGAATAWAMALQTPHRVDRLVVLSVGHPGTAAAFGSHIGAAAAVDPRQRAHWWYMLYFLLPGAEDALQANDWALFRLVMGAGCNEQQLQQYQEQLSQPGALTAALNWYRANISAHHFGQTQPWAAANPLRFPVLGVWSTRDTALQEPQMLASEHFVGSGLWHYARLEGVGHWMPREAPDLINQLLLEFMATAEGIAPLSKQDATPFTKGVNRGSKSKL